MLNVSLQSFHKTQFFSRKKLYINVREIQGNNFYRENTGMAIGARDVIDQLLVQKYAEEKVDNHENMISMVDPEKMMSAMRDYAAMQANMFALSQRLQKACYSINARTAKYKDPSVASALQ